MGKTSKWLRNLLTGKKEEKDKKTYKQTYLDTSFLSESLVIPNAFFPETPNEKKRWSFGRSSERLDISNHKSCRSLDAIATARLVSQALLGYETEQAHVDVGFVSAVATAKSTMSVSLPPNMSTATLVAASPEFKAIENAAATRIQAFFRSYLARKALKALRGLVKIQALVRGHLVRKQTCEMLRCMNALMTIQVRARVQRIQMAEEPPVFVKRRITHTEPSQEKQHLSRGYNERNDVNLIETRTVSSRSMRCLENQPQTETKENRFNADYSGRISISKQKNQLCSNSSTWTDTCSIQLEDDTPSRTSQQKLNISKFDHALVLSKTHPVEYHDLQIGPNYMANTESSKAKARSQSEPKQRPTKKKTRRTPSFGGMNSTPDNQTQYLSSNTKKQQPWLIKIYKAAMTNKDIKCDSTSIGTNISSYNQTLTAYEPVVSLY